MNRCPRSVVVIGVGNDLRADDAAGLEVARRLRKEPGIAVKVHAGEAIDLLELWSDADAVVLVDTVRSGEVTGTIRRFDATSDPVPLPLPGSSSHTIGVAEAIELARTLGSLPQQVIVYGVEGARFALAGELSDEVERTIDPLADAVREEARALLARQLPKSPRQAPSRPPPRRSFVANSIVSSAPADGAKQSSAAALTGGC